MSASAPRGSDTPPWTRRGDDSWGGQRESGSAFRGVSRGRGRGGGAPRGRQAGRGAGGRSVSTRTALPEVKSTPPPLPEKPAGSASKNGTPSKGGREFPKVSSRPNLVVDSQASQNPDATSPFLPNKSPRRRRNTNKRSVSAALPKPIPTSLTDALPTSPSTPLMPPSRDAKVLVSDNEKSSDPGASVHDLRKDIKDLVDHVRNMAMESNRPNSPSTHIDWAREEDDSLPDLDDWGVSSKLTSDVGEISTNGMDKPPSKLEVSPIPAPILTPKQDGAKDHAIAEIVTVDGTQSSAESPTESSMSLSVPPPAKRLRERRRVSNRRDKEKRTARVNASKDVALPSSGTPKKSLLERLSSSVRPEAPALPGMPSKEPSKEQSISTSMSEPGLPAHPSLPPKPSSLPKKLSLPVKDSASTKKNQHVVSSPKGSASLSNSGSNTSTSNLSGPTNNAERQPTAHQTESQTAETTKVTKESSFDWSEEPVSFEPISADEPSVDIEPATPHDNNVTQPFGLSLFPAPDMSDTKSDASSAANPRFRSQRPLSGDATPTPRTRRERSPYKTHNPRNYSAPNAGSGSPGAGRSPHPQQHPQHASRPIIRMDALAMITRSLRESPTPPRRDSPPATKLVQ